MNADKNGNWNWDITIRDIEESDFYDGITVQSYLNTDAIYEITEYKGEWMYRVIGFIKNRQQHYKYSEVIKHVTKSPIPINNIEVVNWVETIYSRKMNIKHIREEKLKLLGI